MSNARVIRNPITGEEIIYKKGPRPPENQIPDMNHEDRVKSLLGPDRNEFLSYEKKQDQKPPSENLSLKANASSIPLLNFVDLLSEDRPKMNSFRDKNPIINPILIEKSARPKSSYSYAVQEAVQSPLLAYHQKLQNPSPQVSHLDAPRVPEIPNILPLPEGPAVQKKNSIYHIDRVAELEKLWLSNGQQTPKPTNDESKLAKEKLIIDTVVTDQLSKFVISETPRHPNQKTIYTARGNKHTIMDNHLRPTSSLSENLLAKKCKFNCRIRSPNGRLALRDLFGILFLHDGSLTIYEFRLLCSAYLTGTGSGNVSKKANALPFLSRKVYIQEYGRRKGKPVDLFDLFKGAILYLPCNMNETSLPDTVRQKDYLEIEIIDVNELEKENLLVGQILSTPIPGEDMNRQIFDVKEKLKNKLDENEIRDLKVVNSVRKFMVKQIENRSVEVYMGLSKSLKNRSLNNELKIFGYITQQDFYDALIEYNIQIHAEDLNIVWQSIDFDNLGHLSYYNVLRAYFGEMNTERHSFFRQLMLKLDTQKVGYVQVSDVYKYYKAARHPKVKNGDIKEDQMFKKFLEPFDLIPLNKVADFFQLSTSTDTKSPLISYEQLEEYYNGLSIVVESDEDFINILKNSWNQ